MDEAFLAEIAARPEDPEPYLVYADALMQRGDPRGELIVTQHALETASGERELELRRREAELFEANVDRWLPKRDYAGVTPALAWRFGFVHRARLVSSLVPDVLAIPHARSTLAELRLHGDDATMTDTLGELRDVAVRRLFVAEGLPTACTGVRPYSLFRLALPALEHLAVYGTRIEFGWRAPPASLRRLELVLVEALPALGTHVFAELEHLRVWGFGAEALAQLDPARFPKLRSLAIHATANTAEVCTRLAAHPVLPQLASLDLSGGDLRDPDVVKPLVERMHVDVSRNLLTPGMCAAIPRATSEHQRKNSKRPLDLDELRKVERRIQLAVERYRQVFADESDPSPDDVLDAYRGIAKAGMPIGPRAADSQRIAIWRGYTTVPVEERIEIALGAADELRLHLPEELDRIRFAFDSKNDLVNALLWGWRAYTAALLYPQEALLPGLRQQLSRLALQRGDGALAAKLAEAIAKDKRKQGDKAGEAWALRQQGNAALIRSDFVAAEKFYTDALALARQAKDTANTAAILSELSAVMWSKQDWPRAEQLARDSIAMRSDKDIGRGSGYTNLAVILSNLHRTTEALAAADRGFEIFEQHKHELGMAQAMSLKGELYQRCNEHAKARSALDDALYMFQKRGGTRETGIVLGNLSRLENDLGNYESARRYCERAIEIHREVGNKFNEGMQLMGIADAEIGRERYDEAIDFCDQALGPLRAIDNHPGLSAVYFRLALVYQLLGDPARAKPYLVDAIIEAEAAHDGEAVGWIEAYQALFERDAALLERAATKIAAHSVQGQEVLAMARAVLAGGELPAAHSWDARILARFAKR